MSSATALLARTQLFRELDEATLGVLAERSFRRSYKRGAPIFFEGDPGDSLFVLTDGLVKVFVTSEAGDEMVLTTLRPPDVFGEVALIDGGPRSASAEALETTTVLGVTRVTLLELLHAQPSLTDGLLQTLGSVVRRLTEQASDLVFLDLHGRVAKLLLNLAERSGEDQGDGILLDLHMTQTDLAGMVGGSRQSVNQILQIFQGRGYIELKGRKLVIRQPERLRRRAGM